jgi:hypothetical protein
VNPVLTGMANFEEQAAAVRSAMRDKIGSEHQHLAQACRSLEKLAGLRKTCLTGPGRLADDELSNYLCDEIAELLELPIGK